MIAETLVRVPVANHPLVLSKLHERMIVVPFDAVAASKHAELFAKQLQRRGTDEQADSISRDELKFDLMIVACAVVQGAEILYTHDGHLATVARGEIITCQLPEYEPTQLSLDSEAGSES